MNKNNGRNRVPVQAVKSFLSSSSIHGFPYFVNKDMGRWERAFWIVTTFVVIIITIVAVDNAINKWANNQEGIVTDSFVLYYF
jgi:hypothetical protein